MTGVHSVTELDASVGVMQVPKGDGGVNTIANPHEISVPSQTAAPLVRQPEQTCNCLLQFKFCMSAHVHILPLIRNALMLWPQMLGLATLHRPSSPDALSAMLHVQAPPGLPPPAQPDCNVSYTKTVTTITMEPSGNVSHSQQYTWFVPCADAPSLPPVGAPDAYEPTVTHTTSLVAKPQAGHTGEFLWAF